MFTNVQLKIGFIESPIEIIGRYRSFFNPKPLWEVLTSVAILYRNYLILAKRVSL